MRLTTIDVGHRFGDGNPLFSEVSVVLHAERTYALLGPSGSGKSTFLGILAGWITPTSGAIERSDAGTTSWVFQNPHGVSGRAALDHVALPYLAQGLDRPRANALAKRLLARVGLHDKGQHPFSTLSGGEAQRLMLARAIASGPGLLLIDEPTAQLDRRSADAVNAAIGAISASGAIVVVATHDERMTKYCTDVIDLTDYSG